MVHHVYGFKKDGIWYTFTDKKKYTRELLKYAKSKRIHVV
jgi:hypothetical protein